jgi:hypothetical protein
MKLTVADVIILVVGVVVLAPVASALLTPTPDAVNMGLLWLAVVAVFVAGFFIVRWFVRRG